MAKPKMKGTIIPKFSSEAEEAAWWDVHRSEVEMQIRKRIKQNRPVALGKLAQAEKPKTLGQMLKEVSPARRKRIEHRAAQFIAEEKSLRKLTQERTTKTFRSRAARKKI